jgi:hypothetical protein
MFGTAYRQHRNMQTAEDNADRLLTWPGLLWLDLVAHCVTGINSCKWLRTDIKTQY